MKRQTAKSARTISLGEAAGIDDQRPVRNMMKKSCSTQEENKGYALVHVLAE
jgi:hypothetical protein